MSVGFAEVKQILDDAVAAWTARTGRVPDLPGVHTDPDFGWETRDQLLAATAFGYRLIEPALIGSGQGHQTNLVLALTTGVDGLDRMPDDGPYIPQARIDRIIEWINEGCPTDEQCDDRAAAAPDLVQTVEMLMRDPEVHKQADIAPYPDGPGKLIHKWAVSIAFNPVAGSPIKIRVTGIAGGTAGVRPGNVFDLITANDIFQNTGFTYQGTNTSGCVVLQKATILPSNAPVYDPAANLFPDPTATYAFHRMNANGRWFLVQWTISHAGGKPSLTVTAKQQPRVATVAEQRCP